MDTVTAERQKTFPTADPNAEKAVEWKKTVEDETTAENAVAWQETASGDETAAESANKAQETDQTDGNGGKLPFT
ncbi:MAG: hypothetical protein LBU45_07290, partial [Azoarcus sp.]|nr:hypothetical protein [Azoarcus sp.]